MKLEQEYKGLSSSEVIALQEMVKGDSNDYNLGLDILESLNISEEPQFDELYITIYIYFRVALLEHIAVTDYMRSMMIWKKIEKLKSDEWFLLNKVYERVNAIYGAEITRRGNFR